MIGTVVVTHDNIAVEMVSTVKRIVPDAKGVVAVAISSDDPVETNRQKIAAAIKEVDTGEGVLLMTDMFGGTPSNICLSFLEDKNIEVISGLNLPMLIKLVSNASGLPFAELAEFIQNYGQKNIVIASHVLKK